MSTTEALGVCSGAFVIFLSMIKLKKRTFNSKLKMQKSELKFKSNPTGSPLGVQQNLLILFLFAFIFLVPGVAICSLTSDFKVNNQSTYAIPPGTNQVLILDLTLSESLKSIKINNAGTAQQWDISKISVFEDGPSLGWDGDEKEIVSRSSSPFFDTLLSGDFSAKRIFVTVDISANAASEKTIKPQVQVDVLDEEIIGFERMILAGASYPTAPVAPLAQTGEPLSTSTIRWRFLDLSNNEFGFKILDNQLRVAAKKENAGISYLDEIGLNPSTCYSGRRAVAFNDRGESNYSVNFSEVCTLALPVVEVAEPASAEAPAGKEETAAEEVPAEEVAEEVPAEKPVSEMTAEELKVKIFEIQQKIIELLNQLIQLIQQQIAELLA